MTRARLIVVALLLLTGCAARRVKAPAPEPLCDDQMVYPGAQEYLDYQLQGCHLDAKVRT